jgi:hypothetical protein
MIKIILISISISCFSLSLFSQSIVSGTIKDAKGDPLTGASVYLEGTYDGTSSDEDGCFMLSSKKKGIFNLKVDFIGFEPFTKSIVLSSNPVQLNIVLKEKFNQLNAVSITAGTFEASDKKKTVILSSVDMVTTASANGDVFGALQALPGTTTVGESGKLFVKGGSSEESQTYIDGTLVNSPYNSAAPNLSTRGRFNPFMFQGTIFSTGGYSAEYGQALSSVLLLNTKDMPLQNELNISILSVGADLGGTKLWKNGAITASLAYNNMAPYMSLIPQNYNWIQAPTSLDGAVSIRQKTGKSGLFKFYGRFTHSNFKIYQPDPDQNLKELAYDLGNDNVYVNASWRSMLSKNWVIKSGVSFTKDNDEVGFDQSQFTKSLKGSHLKMVLSNQISELIMLKFGTELLTKEYREKFAAASEIFDQKFVNNTSASFVEADIYGSSKFVTRIGARFEYSNYLKRSSLSPRISMAYKLNDFSQFSLAYGWFYQHAPDNYLLYTHQLKDERADHYIFSFQSSKNKRTFRSELFYKDYKNLAKINHEAFYLADSYSNTGKGYAYGLDIFWRDKTTIKNGEYWISYSYLDTKRDFRNFPIQAIPTFASKHNLAVVYKHWFARLRSLVGATYRYSSPRYYNNPNSPVFNDSKMLAYQSLDVNCSFLYRDNIIIYAGVTNILGFKRQFGYKYASSPNEDGIYEGMPMLPGSNRFIVLACFITLSKKGDINQLDKIE